MKDPRAARLAIQSRKHRTARYPRVHGSPVHIGRAEMIGIQDLSPAWVGDATNVAEDELPLIWACGGTPQSVVLDTDLQNSSLAER